MREADPSTLREFETWLSLFTEGDLPERHRWKAWFCVSEYEQSDFEGLAATLDEHDSAASFAFLGRDASDQADIIETLDAAGHEVVLHSNRHHAYSDLSYDDAHDAISTGMASIEDSTGVTPQGFFPPFLELSQGAVEAVQDIGFEWVFGRTDSGLEGTELLEPMFPFDTRLLEDTTPDEAMAQLRADAEEGGAPFLFHPPVVEYHDGMDAFETWIGEVGPTTIAEQVAGDGTGAILDCARPVRVE